QLPMPAPGTSPARPAPRLKPARRDARTDRPEPQPDDRWFPPGHRPAPRQEVQAETPSSSGRIERDPEESSQGTTKQDDTTSRQSRQRPLRTGRDSFSIGRA